MEDFLHAAHAHQTKNGTEPEWDTKYWHPMVQQWSSTCIARPSSDGPEAKHPFCGKSIDEIITVLSDRVATCWYNEIVQLRILQNRRASETEEPVIAERDGLLGGKFHASQGNYQTGPTPENLHFPQEGNTRHSIVPFWVWAGT